MTLQQAIKVLETYNKWRKGAEIPQEKPHIIGMAIDIVVYYHKDEPITLIALLDRGFKKISVPKWTWLALEIGGSNFIFHTDKGVEISTCNFQLKVPNCRTLKQLDNLIELFKEK